MPSNDAGDVDGRALIAASTSNLEIRIKEHSASSGIGGKGDDGVNEKFEAKLATESVILMKN